MLQVVSIAGVVHLSVGWPFVKFVAVQFCAALNYRVATTLNHCICRHEIYSDYIKQSKMIDSLKPQKIAFTKYFLIIWKIRQINLVSSKERSLFTRPRIDSLHILSQLNV